MTERKRLYIGVAGFALIAALLALRAVLDEHLLYIFVPGELSHAYYEPMKWTVVVGCALSMWALTTWSKLTFPLCAALFYVSIVHALSSMRKHEWYPFNVAAVCTLLIAAILLMIASYFDKRPTLED